MKSTGPEKGKNPAWRALASVNLTLLLLIILAITSIFGTLIPQQESAMELAHRLSPSLVRVLNSLQVFDLYHSYWFRLIIGILALNLIVCSLERFPSSLRLFLSSPQPDRAKAFENLPPHRVLVSKRELTEVADQITDLLRGKYGKVEKKETQNAQYVYAQKGRYSYFGVYLVHFSVLLILIGSIIGSFFGFEAFVNITEGDTVDTIMLRPSQVQKQIPFSVRCDKFIVEFYQNGTPREYRSELAFLSEGKAVLQGALLVNHPMTFMGITFYQSSYGTIGKKVRLIITQQGDSAKAPLEVNVGQPTQLPGGSAQFQVLDARPDFMRMGPAAHVAIKPPQGEEVYFWVFQNQEMINQRFPGMLEKFPKFNPRAFNPYTFFLDGIETKYYTGLQVNRDPGVAFVYAGFCILIVGLFITFFMSHRRVRIQISRVKNNVSIRITGRANKNQMAIEKEMDDLAHTLRARLE